VSRDFLTDGKKRQNERRMMDFASFVDDAIRRAGLSVLEFENRTGDRFRHVKQGRQKPPLASLATWADVLHLNDDERLQMLILANEAHGGGTIAGWIASEISRLRAQAAERDERIVKLSLELERLRKAGESKSVEK
jgi:hypothetical protein